MGKTSKKILVIDDDPVTRRTMSRLLSNRGYQVTTEANGEDSVKKVLDSEADLVLLDMVMPEISGLEVLKTLRNSFSQQQLPVLMVTANDTTSDVVESLRCGANDFITKPADIEVLCARVESQLVISELNRVSSEKERLEAVNAMVVTYNHEINNPLTVALGYIDSKAFDKNCLTRQKIKDSLVRIAEVVKEIKKIAESEDGPEFKSYVGESKMLKIKS